MPHGHHSSRCSRGGIYAQAAERRKGGDARRDSAPRLPALYVEGARARARRVQGICVRCWTVLAVHGEGRGEERVRKRERRTLLSKTAKV